MKILKKLSKFWLFVLFVSCTASPQKETASAEDSMMEQTSATAIDTFAIRLGLNQPLPPSFVETLHSVSKDVGVDKLTKDFSFDTLTSTNGADLIFCNNRIVEGFVTYIFSHDGNYSETYRHAGFLADVNKKDSVLVILDPDCCAGNNMRHLMVSFANKNFQNRYCIYSIVDMQWPVSTEMVPVETSVEAAEMRTAPIEDDSTYNDDLHCNGNSIGKFPIQTSGVSLSVETDSLGRKWAFVLLKEPPYDNTHVWSIKETGCSLFAGWMQYENLNVKHDEGIDLPQYLMTVSDFKLP